MLSASEPLGLITFNAGLPGGGVLLGFHVWGVPPGSSNPDPNSGQNISFFIPVSSPGF